MNHLKNGNQKNFKNEILIVPSEKETNIEGYYYIPDYDVLPYENLRPSWYVRSRRIYALYLAFQGKLKGVATLRSILHFVMPFNVLKKYIISLKPGDILPEPEKLFSKLGYERVFNVREGGTFSIKGEILDYIGPDNVPVRIELYDSMIEEIKRFDVKTQRSQEVLENALILPAREFVLENWQFDKFDKFDKFDNSLVDRNNVKLKSVFNQSNLFNEPNHLEQLNYLKKQLDEERDEQFTGQFVRGTLLDSDYGICFYILDKKSTLEHFISFERELRNLIKDENLKYKYKTYGIFDYENLLAQAQEITKDVKLKEEKKTKKAEEEYIPSIPLISEEELSIGDIVVHKKYGIARFSEIKKIETENGTREFMVLNFADTNLYVPIERIDLIDKYFGDSAGVKLDSLKNGTWERKVSKVRKNLEQIVRELLLIHHIRSTVRGVSLTGDAKLEEEFSKTFEYVETEDQLKAIEEVFGDLASEKPMDRLLVGDAGYGKTEVAIRALFRTVVSGKQGALLAPTTVLAKQHFKNISERFKPFGIRVASLSRFTTKKEREEILKGVRNGSIDVLIGTHSILNDVIFSDLGLVVIDEEQKFGVEQKEKFKKLRVNVNVLTMSATPIPRTLHMALSELKDFSEIKTAPFGRKETQIYVGNYDEKIVKIAILRELNRGGQVIYVHNRVNTIYDVYNHLKKLLPDVNIAVGHGQMSKSELKKSIDEFFHGKVDVLVCTTIIENGIDVPNANTIIVDDAHRYGLAQLYQLRGRVGRSDKLSFAYFLHPKNVNTKVLERLYAIKSYTGPGSGLKIAMKDMEIRGIGQIFGIEQHGFIKDVGLKYYLEMLNEIVMQNKNNLKNKIDTEIEGIVGSIIIPETYVYDPFERMRFYRRIASAIEIEEIIELREELEDRFGKIPESVENLLKMSMLRIILWEHGVKKAYLSNVTIAVEFKETEKLTSTSNTSTGPNDAIDKVVEIVEKLCPRYMYNKKEKSYILFTTINELLNKFVNLNINEKVNNSKLK